MALAVEKLKICKCGEFCTATFYAVHSGFFFFFSQTSSQLCRRCTNTKTFYNNKADYSDGENMTWEKNYLI